MARIKITIKKDGTQTFDVLDGQGADCLQLTDDLEKRQGVMISRELKPEIHEEVVVPVNVNVTVTEEAG